MDNKSSPLQHIEKIEYHIHNHVDLEEIINWQRHAKESLNTIIKNQSTIMALIDDLKTQVEDLKSQATELQASVDAEQAQIQSLLDSNASVVNDLNAQITALQGQLADSATPAAIQEVIDGLTQVKDSIATTKADIEGTVQ